MCVFCLFGGHHHHHQVSTVEGGLGKRRVELKQVEALIEMEREQQAMLIMRITQELDDQVRRDDCGLKSCWLDLTLMWLA